jgi:polygalacturonase
VLAVAAAALLAAPEAAGRAGLYDVRDFGAKGDGVTVDSPAINAAIDAAAAAGGGSVRLPAGRYLSATVRLKSHVGLYLEHGAVLLGATEKQAAYDDPEPNEVGEKYQDFGHSHWRNSLIAGLDVEDVSIEGPGLIDGTNLTRATTPPKGAANKTIGLKRCRHVTIRDVSIFHGGHFAILATGVDDLTIDNVRVDTYRDGIDVDACRNVRISNTHVNSPWDDAICLKASYALGVARDTANVVITNSVVTGYDEGTFLDGTYTRRVKATHLNIPTARIKMGTESSGGFKNITISNCVFEWSRGLALEAVDGGSIEDVTISNLTMRDIVNSPIFVRLGRRLRSPKGTPIGVLRRVQISNVVASNVTDAQGILVSGIEGHPIEDLRLSDVHIEYQGGGTAEDAARVVPDLEDDYPEPRNFGRLPAYGLYARHVHGFDVRGLEVRPAKADARPPLILDQIDGAVLDDLQAPSSAGVPPLVLKNVKDILVSDSFGIVSEHVASAALKALPTRPAEETGWTSLFDGKSLAGWTKYGGVGTFEVKDGAILGTFVKDPGPKESTYLATEKEFGDFELEMELKADPGINSGVQFRSFYDKDTRGKVQGYQYEIDATARGLTAGIYDQSRRGWLVPPNEPAARAEYAAARGRAFKIGEWNQLRVVCRGSKLQTFLNGEAMAELTDDRTPRGFVALQVHQTTDDNWVGKTVAWRNIRIRPLE